MLEKQFKTLDEQIEIFKHKGLVIDNEDYAKEILLRENYFFLNGYRHLFMKSSDNSMYIPGTKIEELYSLFLFDRRLRSIFFKNILIVENNVKSIISYQLSKKYGYKEKDYLKVKNFTQIPERQRQVNDLIKKMKRQIRINGSQHTATSHYVSHYGYIPLWILVKVLSFGVVSEMVSILKPEDQKDISNIYGITTDDFINYLPILANYRNLCAHEDILYENRTQKEISDTIYHKILNIPRDEEGYIYGKNDLFALIIIMKQMLLKEEFKNMTFELDNIVQTLNYNLTSIKIDKVLNQMGFPLNWEELSKIERPINDEE